MRDLVDIYAEARFGKAAAASMPRGKLLRALLSVLHSNIARGAGIGGVGGALTGLVAPSEGEDRLRSALRRGTIGAGAGVGYGAGATLGIAPRAAARKLLTIRRSFGGHGLPVGSARGALAHALETLGLAATAGGAYGGYRAGKEVTGGSSKKAAAAVAVEDVPKTIKTYLTMPQLTEKTRAIRDAIEASVRREQRLKAQAKRLTDYARHRLVEAPRAGFSGQLSDIVRAVIPGLSPAASEVALFSARYE